MRTLLILTILVAALTPARAEDDGIPKSNITKSGGVSRMFPGVRENGRPMAVYMGVVIGRIGSELNDDRFGRGMTENSGWAYGLNIRGEVVTLKTAYGGDFGFMMDVDLFLTTPGVVEGPASPKASIFFAGITPSLALGLLKTKRWQITSEIGFPVNTDFYGFSGGLRLSWKYWYLNYRVRSGKGYHGTEVLDERVRFGIADVGSNLLSKMFFGFEVIDGYSEDERGRADLGQMFRGSYTMISLIIAKGAY